MTRLLLSVRNSHEAELALSAGVDLIDVKEPNAGSLGKADPTTLEEIANVVNGRAPLSAACGELCDWNDKVSMQTQGIDARFQFAKVGLQNCAESLMWQADWRAWRRSLPQETLPVLVIYADNKAAQSPTIDRLFDFARSESLRYILIDTFDKSGPGLLEILTKHEITEIVRAVQSEDRKIVLAGKLTLDQAESMLDLGPDFFAVRGAVCESSKNRASEVSFEKIQSWKSLLSRQISIVR